jgi:hypothetical protein
VTNNSTGPKQPSLIPGVVLLGLAAVLIVVVLINPDMSGGLRTGIAIAAVVVVITLLAYAFRMWLTVRRGGQK